MIVANDLEQIVLFFHNKQNDINALAVAMSFNFVLLT